MKLQNCTTRQLRVSCVWDFSNEDVDGGSVDLAPSESTEIPPPTEYIEISDL